MKNHDVKGILTIEIVQLHDRKSVCGQIKNNCLEKRIHCRMLEFRTILKRTHKHFVVS